MATYLGGTGRQETGTPSRAAERLDSSPWAKFPGTRGPGLRILPGEAGGWTLPGNQILPQLGPGRLGQPCTEHLRPCLLGCQLNEPAPRADPWLWLYVGCQGKERRQVSIVPALVRFAVQENIIRKRRSVELQAVAGW